MPTTCRRSKAAAVRRYDVTMAGSYDVAARRQDTEALRQLRGHGGLCPKTRSSSPLERLHRLLARTFLPAMPLQLGVVMLLFRPTQAEIGNEGPARRQVQS